MVMVVMVPINCQVFMADTWKLVVMLMMVMMVVVMGPECIKPLQLLRYLMGPNEGFDSIFWC